MQYSAVQYSAVQCNTVQYSAAAALYTEKGLIRYQLDVISLWEKYECQNRFVSNNAKYILFKKIYVGTVWDLAANSTPV